MKTAVITGATSGIGFEVAAALKKSGCRVIGIGRNAINCQAAQEKLTALRPSSDVTFFCGDLMQQSEVRRLAGEIHKALDKTGGALHALINNAGCVRSWYMTTDEGFEQQFALNHLAGFLLTHELLPNLIRGGGRILFTSSGSHKMTRMNWQDLMFQKRYRPLYAYKQSKLCNMLTAFALNDRFSNRGIRAYGVDPGLVRTEIGNKNTGKLVDFIWKRRSRHGVDPSVPAKIFWELIHCMPEAEGLYYGLSGSMKPSGEVSQKNADRLFELSEKLCGIRFGVEDICSS